MGSMEKLKKKKSSFGQCVFALSLGNKGPRPVNKKPYFLWEPLSLWVPFDFDFMSSNTKVSIATMNNPT